MNLDHPSVPSDDVAASLNCLTDEGAHALACYHYARDHQPANVLKSWADEAAEMAQVNLK